MNVRHTLFNPESLDLQALNRAVDLNMLMFSVKCHNIIILLRTTKVHTCGYNKYLKWNSLSFIYKSLFGLSPCLDIWLSTALQIYQCFLNFKIWCRKFETPPKRFQNCKKMSQQFSKHLFSVQVQKIAKKIKLVGNIFFDCCSNQFLFFVKTNLKFNVCMHAIVPLNIKAFHWIVPQRL